MNQNQPDQIDVKKIVTALLRKKWLIVVTLFGFLIPIIYYNMTSPLIYKQRALVLFDSQRGPESIVNPFQLDLRQNFIMNQIAMMKTETFASKVFDKLSKEDIASFAYPEKTEKTIDTTAFVIKKINLGLKVQQYPKADIIEIGFEYVNPNLVKKVANTAADVLVNSNLESIRESSTNVRELVGKQLKVYEAKLEDAEKALKDYKEKSNISISPDKESQEIFARITDAEVLFNKTRSEHDAAKKRLEYIQKKIAEQRKDITPTEVTSPWIQKLKENLVDLEVQYTTLKVQNYSENHPKMLRLKDEIDQTKKKIKEETIKLAQGENLIDPLSQIQKFLEESITLDIEIQTYKAQEEGLRKIIDGYYNNLKSVPEKELELAKLTRDKKVTEEIYTMLMNKFQEARIAEAQNVSYIRVIDPAKTPNSPIRPRKMLNLIIGIILGTSFGVGLVLVMGFLDNSVKSVEDIEKLSNLSVLATIPIINKNGTYKLFGKTSKINSSIKISDKLITELEPKSPESEAFRSLRTNIKFANIDKTIKSILITSAHPGAGKSLISANLAIAMAQAGTKTILIDGDLRKPVQHTLFNVDKEPGLTNLIVSAMTTLKEYSQQIEQQKTADSDIKENLLDESNKDLKFLKSNYIRKYIEDEISNVIKSTYTKNLFLLTCGVLPPNPSEILASKILKIILQILSDKFDLAIIDSPPILAVTDSAILSNFVDGSLLVIRNGKDSGNDLIRSQESLVRVGGNLLGSILNGVDVSGGYYYHYYYAKDQKKKQKKKNK